MSNANTEATGEGENQHPDDAATADAPPPPSSSSPSSSSPRGGRPKREKTISDLLAFPPTRQKQDSNPHAMFNQARPVEQSELMGPLLRRKKVVSLPLGAGGDFFVSEDVGGPHRRLFDEYGSPNPARYHRHHHPHRVRQHSAGSAMTAAADAAATQQQRLERQVTPPPAQQHRPGGRRVRQTSLGDRIFGDVVRRKQVSLDLLGPNDFFVTSADQYEHLLPQEEGGVVGVAVADIPEGDEGGGDGNGVSPSSKQEAALAETQQVKLFAPLRFAPRMEIRTKRGGGGHGGGGGGHDDREKALTSPSLGSGLMTIDEETTESLHRFSRYSSDLQLQVSTLMNHLQDEENSSPETIKQISSQIALTQSALEKEQSVLEAKIPAKTDVGATSDATQGGGGGGDDEQQPDGTTDVALEKKMSDDDDDEMMYGFDDEIIRATRCDKIKTAVLFVIMLSLTLVFSIWDTHLDVERFIHSPVGLACVTECEGNLESRDFFRGHSHFEPDQVIQLIMHLDPNEDANHDEIHPVVKLVGEETGEVKAVVNFRSPDAEDRMTYEENVKVTFDHPEEHHILIITSSEAETVLSFTLSAHALTPLANYSELCAALIMVVVYLFILLEVIHRTLVAIFGSMVALMFFFIMHNGDTESIAQLMLHLEWSTLGLLFGMMLIVGELSHTGVFEWCSVRLLVASKGSFIRLMILLCTLTAVASAFLDNVTTMLLVAPVTIDMCNILQVDPRPYLIGEVLLSNIGGTATLIGDPPNIIIGSSFEEIGFVDFIVNILPAIFLLCIPVSLALICWIYRYYLTSTEMRVLDTAKLKQTYPIYDEPRLMIAGTVTFFVIVMFFLHPVHHKDTAWVALLGAFICIAFTNPHDVQEALRSHVEWDTLLFFAGLFVLVEVCAAMGLLSLIGDALASLIEQQDEDKQLTVAITLILWVSAVTSAFLDNIPYTATMIPIVKILAEQLPDTLPIETLAWALSFGACLGGNGTLLGASANIVTAGISTNKGFEISFLNFFYPGMMAMIATVGISNIYMLVRYSWT